MSAGQAVKNHRLTGSTALFRLIALLHMVIVRGGAPATPCPMNLRVGRPWAIVPPSLSGYAGAFVPRVG